MGVRKSKSKIETEDISAKYKEFAGGGKTRAPPLPKPFKCYFVEVGNPTTNPVLPPVIEVSRDQFKIDSVGCTVYKGSASKY